MKKIEIPISGMHCASCVNNVEQYLKKLNGIVSVSVNLAAEKAFIEYDEGQIDIAGIVKAVIDSGYQVPETLLSSEAPALAAVLSLDARREEYYLSLKRRFLFALIFTVPVFLGGMHMFFPFLPAWLHDPYIMLALAAPVQIFSGWPFYQGLWASIKRRNADMNTLVAVGTTAAFGYSLAATFIPEFFARAGQSPVYYYDSAAVIITLILLGRMLEAKARGRTSEAIKRLIGLQARTARVFKDGGEIEAAAGATGNWGYHHRPAGRKNSRRRGHHRGIFLHRRIDDHRGEHPGRQKHRR